MMLTRRGAFGAGAAAAASIASPATATPAAPVAAEGASAQLAIRVAGTAVDRMKGIVGLVLRPAAEGETPNAWAAFAEDKWGGVVYDSEQIARYSAIEAWSCVDQIRHEIADLKGKLSAKHVLVADYEGDFIMVSDEYVVGIEDAEDYVDDVWLYGAEEEAFGYDPVDELNEYLSEWFEDADDRIPREDKAKLDAVWREIMAKHGGSLTRYSEDVKTIVVIDQEEFAKEAAAWPVRLALCEAALARLKLEGPSATHLLYVCETVCQMAKWLARDDHWRWRRRA